ncbi:MAG: fumarylacetoacetate hydrolase family protein [Microbacteriaceae bacterium]|nr:MAG: fumarylacetoacetate hydrolase family protein [Microbacteriaceae bacterium]
MRFAHLSVDGEAPVRLASVIDDRAIFLDDVMMDAPCDLQALLDGGAEALARVRARVDRAVVSGARSAPVHELRHASAVRRPPLIIAIGANYAAHASELALKVEKAPTIFALWPSSLTGHESTITWREDLTSQVDYEAELGVIIGKPAKDVSEHQALDYVFGYTVVNDVTARDLQFSEAQWSRCKSFDGFTPTGPVVVTADEIGDPQDLWLTTNVDGRVLQDATTGEMVRTVAQLISYLSRTATLQPGTLISTGSPGGAGYSRTPPVFLRDRSAVTVTIEKIGSLTTFCRVI